jgi:hypothetical protein
MGLMLGVFLLFFIFSGFGLGVSYPQTLFHIWPVTVSGVSSVLFIHT